jgi:hypothetical protein
MSERLLVFSGLGLWSLVKINDISRCREIWAGVEILSVQVRAEYLLAFVISLSPVVHYSRIIYDETSAEENATLEGDTVIIDKANRIYVSPGLQ